MSTSVNCTAESHLRRHKISGNTNVCNFFYFFTPFPYSVVIIPTFISTDPGLLKIKHSHRFVAVVIQFLIPFIFSRGVPLNHSLPAGVRHQTSASFSNILLVEGKIEKIQARCIKVASGCKASHGKCLPTYND